MAFSDEELLAVIRGGENDRVEFTEGVRDLDKFRKAICAFANDLPDHRKPGLLFIGLRDDGTCAGLTIDDKLLTTLGGLRSDGNILPLPSMTVEKRELDGCELAVVQVQPSNNPPVKVDGRCWIRIGPRRGQASPEEERQLTEKRRWGNLSFDKRGVAGATVEKDLDVRRFELEYLPAAFSPKTLMDDPRTPRAQLAALHLTAADGTPAAAALLMFGVNPSDWLPGAYIRFVRYEGREITSPVIARREFRGVLPDQISEAEAALAMPGYPIKALREIIRNAVIHRNYEGADAPVRVDCFCDRVVVTSPGGLYGDVTRENFGDSVVDYRNPKLAEMMKDMGLANRFGAGIYFARKALQKAGNPRPEFAFHHSYVAATIRK